MGEKEALVRVWLRQKIDLVRVAGKKLIRCELHRFS